MPTHDFKCDNCSKDFEATMTLRERNTPQVKCPHCGSASVTPQMTTFSPTTSRKS